MHAHGTSRLGDQLSESTTRRVIIMILIMIVVVPLLLYFPDSRGREFGTLMLHTFNTNPSVGTAAQQDVLNTFLHTFQATYNNRYVDYLSAVPMLTPDPYINFHANIKGLREISRKEEYFSTTIGATTYTTSAIFSLVQLVRDTATFSIILTLFVAVMLVGGSLVFTADAQRLVIKPIERMMNMVEAVAANPLEKFQFDDSQTGACICVVCSVVFSC